MAPLLFAAVLFAAAAPRPAPVAPAAPPPEPLAPLSTTAEDRAAAEVMAARLNALDDRIAADEVRVTQLRDVELAASNAVVRSIRPVLPVKGPYVR